MWLFFFLCRLMNDTALTHHAGAPVKSNDRIHHQQLVSGFMLWNRYVFGFPVPGHDSASHYLLCIGKPLLRCLSVSATVADAIVALRRSDDRCVSIWSCDHPSNDADCRCAGKVSLIDISCFLCREENLPSPSTALHSPVEAVIPKVPGLIRHLEPQSSFLEAIELILDGAQNIVVPILSRSTSSQKEKLLNKQNSSLHNNRQYCWLTQEDIIRYLLNSISLFNPIPIQPINSLGIVDTDSVLRVEYDDPAASILPLISESQITHTAIAIVDTDGKLIGEISPFTLNFCNPDTVSWATDDIYKLWWPPQRLDPDREEEAGREETSEAFGALP
ncbi:hypothetical protein SAY86_030062 [Trapa natans]|uniref:CBS domain-containing protein n=1 Tax=Trapa natans TaxID=22666 RepID=A0AAN7MMG7_TRANT|nr:hypothetical protein SAY86_030062 [Trapa natans]